MALALVVAGPGTVAPAAAEPAGVATPRTVADAGPAVDTVPPAGPLKVRLARVDLSSPLPQDLLAPEGHSRWDLRSLTLRERWVRSVVPDDAAFAVEDGAAPGAMTAPVTRRALFQDVEDPGMASRLVRPDRAGSEALRPGRQARLMVDETSDGVTTRLLVDAAIVGIGWVELPSGPREVVLERLLVQRRSGRSGFVPERLVHRFVDPRAGVVAEISGPPAADRRTRAGVAEAFVLDAVLQGAAEIRLYVDDLWGPVLTDLNYSRDRGAGTTVSSLTPAPGVSTLGDLIALSSWDFSGNTTGTEVAFTTVTPSAAETCNFAQCGYTIPGTQLERTDRSFDVPASLSKTNDTVELEVRANDTVIWLRAGSQFEGSTAAPPNGENRFCYTTFGGVTRTPVPLWVLPHQDMPGGPRYTMAGDSWTSGVFNCEQNVFNQVCGASQTLDLLYIKGCTAAQTGTHTGTQFGSSIKGGVVTLPSGHTFNALLVRNVADFCIYFAAGCNALFKASEARTANYLWQVPQVGTVVRLQSPQNAPTDLVSFTAVDEAVISFGLFPPRSISVTGVNDTTVSLSWDPGLDTHRISGYKVYWDTDSGAATPYAFDSESAPGQASITGTTAVISGLAPGTTYHFTITSLSLFTDPSSLITTRYESILYPTQISGDPSFVYPVEVLATTTGGTCIPTVEVTGVTVAHDPGGIQICWNPASDPCLAGYQVLGAATPESAAGYSVVADIASGTCYIGDPSARFFLVVAKGTGGTGPWGHYGQ
jgi:hypothetical protein